MRDWIESVLMLAAKSVMLLLAVACFVVLTGFLADVIRAVL